jgi:hypothetical protein
MNRRFECEEVDPDTLEYLRAIRRHDGEGMPGIYLDARASQLTGNWLPGTGAIVGVCLIIITLCITWNSLDDPINTAMLQTAGLFLGGWMIVAWLRIRLARKRPDWVGYFKFVDPLYLWHASGRGIWVTPLSNLRDADFQNKYDNNGNYNNSQVTIRLGKEKVRLDVKSQYLAQRVEGFVNLLPELDRGTPAERGYEAVDELNLREADESGEEAPAPIRRHVHAIPEPHAVRSVANWWRYPVVIVMFVLAFFWSKTVVTAMRDDEIFSLVTEPNRRPPDLRAYLVDQRNTRHRAEILQRLARFHDDSAQWVAARKGDPQLVAGLASVIRSVGQETRPVVTLSVKQMQEADDRDKNTLFAPAMMDTHRLDLVRKLSDALTTLYGPDLTDFGEVQEGEAMIEIVARAKKTADGKSYHIDWTMTLQASAEAPKFVWKTQTLPVPGAANNFEMLQDQYNDFKARFDRALTTR